MGFCHLQEIYITSMGNFAFEYCYKNRSRNLLNSYETKSPIKFVKPKPMPDVNLRNVEERIIPPEKGKKY